MENTQQPLWSKDFVIIIIINLLVYFSWQTLLPSLPLYAKSLGGSDALLGWLFGAPTIASLIMRPFSGILLDNLGRKKILLPGLFILLCVTFSFPWILSVGMLISVRFLHGLGWGLASTASSTIASDNIPKTHFGEGMGYFSLSNSLAMALAPAVALAIFARKGFKAVSFFASGLTAIVLFLAIFIRGTKATKEKPDRLALYEARSVLPSVVMLLVNTSYGSITGFLALYATSLGISNIGGFFTVYALALFVSRPALGRLTDKYGFNATVCPGLFLLTLSMLILARAVSMKFFLLSALLYGLGFSAVQSSLQTMAIARSSRERLGAANATFFTGFDGGIGLGAVLGGIVASFLGYDGMYLAFSMCTVLAGLVYYVFFMRKSISSAN